MLGVQEIRVQELVGHKDVRTTMVYTHVQNTISDGHFLYGMERPAFAVSYGPYNHC